MSICFFILYFSPTNFSTDCWPFAFCHGLMNYLTGHCLTPVTSDDTWSSHIFPVVISSVAPLHLCSCQSWANGTHRSTEPQLAECHALDSIESSKTITADVPVSVTSDLTFGLRSLCFRSCLPETPLGQTFSGVCTSLHWLLATFFANFIVWALPWTQTVDGLSAEWRCRCWSIRNITGHVLPWSTPKELMSGVL